MTRINVIDPKTLTDSHLLAEHRETTRVPNTINSGKANLNAKIPPQYTLGKGHVSFYYNKLKWLHERYNAVHKECLERGFNVVYKWPDSVPEHLYNDAEIHDEAYVINRERVLERFPKNAKMFGVGITIEQYMEVLK